MNQNILSLQQQRQLTIVTIASSVVIALIILLGYWNIQQDDSYIFYSYANNILNNNSYVFNAEERINATTSPLYTLLLASIAWVFQLFPSITLPIIGHLIGAISLFLTALLLLKCFSDLQSTLFPFLLPLVFLSSPLLANAVGMETSMAMMLVLACLYSWQRGNLLTASLICSLAILTRPDLGLLAVIIPVYDFIRYRRLPSVSMLIVFLTPLSLWFAFSYVYFGDFLPTTLSAKLGQTESGRWGTGLIFLKGLVSKLTWNGTIFMYTTLAVLVFGIYIAVIKVKQWKIFEHPILHVLLIWNIAYLIAYGFVLNPPGYPWYYTPLSIGIAIIISLGLEFIYQSLKNKNSINNNVIIAGFFIVLLLVSITLPLKIMLGDVTSKFESYQQAALWLNKNAENNSSVGANEIGILRYFYSKGPIIDALGLVTPGVADRVKNQDYSWYLHEYKPDYLVFNDPHRPISEAMVKTKWFQDDYGLITKLKTQRKSLAIYKRQRN